MNRHEPTGLMGFMDDYSPISWVVLIFAMVWLFLGVVSAFVPTPCEEKYINTGSLSTSCDAGQRMEPSGYGYICRCSGGAE